MSWACVGAAAKYASFYYHSVVEEYSMITVIIAGFVGSCSIFVVYALDTPLRAEKDDSTLLYILAACGAGFFTTFGLYSFMKALSYGSVGIASLFANMQIIVELIEEFIIFSIIPTTGAFFGMGLALVGSAFMILFQRRSDS